MWPISYLPAGPQSLHKYLLPGQTATSLSGQWTTRHKTFSIQVDSYTPEQAKSPLRSPIGSAVLLWIKTLCEHPLQSVLSHHYSWMSSPPFSLPNTLPLSFKFGRNEIFYRSLQCSRCQNNAEPALGKDLSIP